MPKPEWEADLGSLNPIHSHFKAKNDTLNVNETCQFLPFPVYIISCDKKTVDCSLVGFFCSCKTPGACGSVQLLLGRTLRRRSRGRRKSRRGRARRGSSSGDGVSISGLADCVVWVAIKSDRMEALELVSCLITPPLPSPPIDCGYDVAFHFLPK